MLPSGNDAAHALASAAGGMKQTVALMNAEAERLQARDTTVRNPSGLDARGQYTSAFDLALFARAGLERKDFRRYVGTITTAFPAEMPKKDKRRKSYQIYNQNPLLLDGYRGIVGVKTGYTTLAGRTFVGAAERGKHSLIVTLMGVVEPTDSAAERLLNWGFANIDRVEPVASLIGETGSAHEVRPATAGPAVPTRDDAESAGSGVGWAFVITAVACLATWLVMRRFSRRQRRPSLPAR
jgi:D-alanyl-D-alanine carboxypeptidase (penicillin-binding protein 5/6)